MEPFFHGLLHRMANVLTALEQHSRHHQIRAAEAQGASGGVAVTTSDGQNELIEELQELAERMAGAAVDAQKEHPLGFRRYDCRVIVCAWFGTVLLYLINNLIRLGSGQFGIIRYGFGVLLVTSEYMSRHRVGFPQYQVSGFPSE